ncbi:MAG: hypothetical protein LM556_02510 [Desulfurococcaceae archaeon]|nr:hypothetical protein [Desulfurococcaceae archaeon]
MYLDFLRNIVNPVLNMYIERGLPVKLASEVKRLIFQAESKYKFSVFGGDLRNLKLYLNSKEFSELVKILVESNYGDVLVEILEKAKEAYSELEDLKLAIENALQSIVETSRRTYRRDSEVVKLTKSNIDKLAETIRKMISARDVRVEKRTIKLVIDENTELKLRVLRGRVVLEVLTRRVIEKPTWSSLLEVINELVEKAHRI